MPDSHSSCCLYGCIDGFFADNGIPQGEHGADPDLLVDDFGRVASCRVSAAEEVFWGSGADSGRDGSEIPSGRSAPGFFSAGGQAVPGHDPPFQ